MLVCVVLLCLFLVALWSPAEKGFLAVLIVVFCHFVAAVYMCLVVTCWERADLLALVCGV